MSKHLAFLTLTILIIGTSLAPLQTLAYDDNYVLTFDFPDDPYAVPSTDDSSGWIKFLIKTDDLTTVYFQDSNLYLFFGMSPSEYPA